MRLAVPRIRGRLVALAGVLLTCAMAAVPSTATAASRLFTFDDVEAGTPVAEAYRGSGVSFDSCQANIFNFAEAHSGARIVVADSCDGPSAETPAALSASFAQPRAVTTLYARTFSLQVSQGPADAVLTAFAGSTIVGRQTVSLPDGGWTALRIGSPDGAATITRVELRLVPTFRPLLVDDFGVADALVDTTLLSGPSDPSNSSAASFAFAANDSAASFSCRLDEGAWEPCTSPRAYAGIGEGTHTFAVVATDPIGVTDASPASYSWRVDLTAPQVTAVVPAADAVDVDPRAAIGAQFSEAMDPASIAAGVVILQGPGDVSVPGVVGYDAVGLRATFTPGQPLSAATRYTAIVRGGPGGARDLAGNALAADRVQAFTTAGEDPDRDGILSSTDNCPDVANADQRDTDGDRVGDACEIGGRGDLPPRAGTNVIVSVISGEVYVKLAAPRASTRAAGDRGSGFISLKGVASIPVGSTVDTRDGTVSLRSATSGGTRPRVGTGRMSAAVFKIKQRRAARARRGRKAPRPFTDLELTHTSATLAAARCRRPGPAGAGTGIVRTLQGSSVKGLFRTIGIAATTVVVQNATWTTKDRCDGTLTQVGRGRASVIDRVRQRTVKLRAGQAYFVRANFLARHSRKGTTG